MRPRTASTWRSVPGRVWARYWRYVALSGLLFVAGAAGGGVLVDTVALGEVFGAGGPGGSSPELTVGFLVANNALVAVLLVASGLTLGLGTTGILLFNGFIVGYVVVSVARSEGVIVPVVGILPHGVVEVPALLLASAVAFRFSHQVLAAALGRRESVMTRTERREAVLVAVLALALIPVAAVIEATVTPTLLAGVR